MMKKAFSLLLVLTVVTALGAVTISSPAATVNLTKNRVITMDQLNAEYEFYRKNGVEAEKLDVLNAMIDEILLEQGAARDGYSITDSETEQLYASQKVNVEQQIGRSITDEEFEALVVESYGTVEKYKTYLRNQYVTQLYVYGVKADILENVAMPTENEIKAWYRKNTEAFILPERVRLSVIAVQKTGDADADKAALARITECSEKIKAGELTFEKAVAEYSEDLASLSTGGDWGYMADTETTRTNMGEYFVDKAMLMEPGDVSGVLETPYLYTVIKCTVHSDAQILTLDDIMEEYGITVRDYITQGLYYQNSQYAFIEAYNSLLADLKLQANIKIIFK